MVASVRAHGNYFLSLCLAKRLFSRRQPVSLHLWREKVIKDFTSHSFKIHHSFWPLILLHWKYKTHFLWSTATWNPRKSCGLSEYHGANFLVISLCIRPLCSLCLSAFMTVGFVHTIDPKGSLKHHGKALEFWIPSRWLGMHAENANI